jgi:ATP-dependent helicase/nuclease subunit A
VSCPGEWILQTALKRTEAGAFFTLCGCSTDAEFTEPAWLIRVVETDETVCSVVDAVTEETRFPRHVLKRLERDLSFEYPYIAATKAPSKRTATQLKGRDKDREAAENTAVRRKIKFRSPSFLKAEPNSKEYGTAIHAFMQYVRYSACNTVSDVKNEIRRLTDRKLLTQEQADAINPDHILAFFATELGRKLCQGCEVIREFKFSILDDGEAYVDGMIGERVLLQGVVDCALIEEDGIILLDFKSDRVTENTIFSVAESYRPQVATYARALERIFAKPVKSAQLYFFRLNRFVDIH